VQFRLRRLVNDIVDKGTNKYTYVQRARNLLWALLCQAILNDSKLETYAGAFGQALTLEAQYTDWVCTLATTRCRLILSYLASDKRYAEKVAEGNSSFMRTNAAYRRAMAIAHRRYRWVEKKLNSDRARDGRELHGRSLVDQALRPSSAYSLPVYPFKGAVSRSLNLCLINLFRASMKSSKWSSLHKSRSLGMR
jgi:hypothetical protein